MADEPIPSQLAPYMVELTKGQSYRICRCGRSKKQPFCDNSHEGTGIEPLEHKALRSESVNLCGCLESEDFPFCDGSHVLMI